MTQFLDLWIQYAPLMLAGLATTAWICALATALGLALVTMHRRFFGKRQKIRVVRIGNRLLISNLIVVAVLAALVTGLIFDVVLSRTAGFIALGAGLLVTFGLWAVGPRIGRAEADEELAEATEGGRP